MNGIIESFLALIINFYILCLFVRIFTQERERYDALLGMVFTATDPLINVLGTYWRPAQAQLLPIPIMVLLLLLQGFLFGSLAGSLHGFLDKLFQLYALIMIIISVYRESYINPIANFGQRIVRPVRSIAANFSQNPVVVNVVSIALLIVFHTALTMALHKFLPHAAMALRLQNGSVIYSLHLIVNLTEFFSMVILVNVLLSWVSPDPYNPIVQLLTLIAAPIVEPIRRVLPPLGGVLDLSPIVALFALQFLEGLGHNLLNLL